MICLKCKKQIPEDATKCPFCGNEVNLERQLVQEVKFRRYQRWAFYGLTAMIFLGMIGVIVKIYSVNTAYLNQLTATRNDLEKNKKELEGAQADLSMKASALDAVKTDLEKKANDLKKVAGEKASAEQDLAGEKAKSASLEEYKDFLSSANANIYGLIIKLGTGVKETDLFKIPVADANIDSGKDSDNDGLSDEFEKAIGTDLNKADTDGDGYSDKAEILGGYNPRGAGKQALDAGFANKQKGRILIQTEQGGEAWYVGYDGKRYFLGKPAEAFAAGIK